MTDKEPRVEAGGCPTCDSYGEVRNHIDPDVFEPCPDCAGSGVIYEEHDFGAKEELGCPTCEGTGKATPKDGYGWDEQ